jgi:glutathione S-transferase
MRLHDFSRGTDGWRAVNDGVMGGVSDGAMVPTPDGTAVFRGVLRLEHGGGFASVRGPELPGGLDRCSALRLKVRGDGRRYKVNLRSHDLPDQVVYRAAFHPPAGTWTEVDLPWADFEPSRRGRPVPDAPPLDPGQVREVGLLVSDRQAGEFTLEVAWIDGVRTSGSELPGPLVPRLYVIPVSHPATAARLMLEHKQIAYRLVTLIAGLHPLSLRLAGFRGGTVPALRVGERRVQGSLAISRALDALEPDRPLFPYNPDRRRAVESAELWAEGVLQPVPRRLFRWALTRYGELRRTVIRVQRLPAPALFAGPLRPVAAWYARHSHADSATVATDLADLPKLLDHVDALIARGTIGGQEPNAADFQIGTTVRLLLAFDDLAPAIAGRPAAEHALRWVPEPGLRVPRVFPGEWLTPLRAG